MFPDVETLKCLTIEAIVSVDELFERLVLKGGNALSLAHRQMSRASFDLDFSMPDAFDSNDLPSLKARLERELERTFDTKSLVVFDVKFEERPEKISSDLESFWGGYSLEFKLISRERFDELNGALDRVRKEAVPPRPGGKARFEIDISRYEYCEGKQATEIGDFTVFVYTPVMIVCEKIRALCQQIESYTLFVRKHRARRARDFFDIYETVTSKNIDLTTPDNLRLICNVFDAKRVPLELLTKLEGERDFHRQAWDSVRDTVDAAVNLNDFDFYFDFTIERCEVLAQCLRT